MQFAKASTESAASGGLSGSQIAFKSTGVRQHNKTALYGARQRDRVRAQARLIKNNVPESDANSRKRVRKRNGAPKARSEHSVLG